MWRRAQVLAWAAIATWSSHGLIACGSPSAPPSPPPALGGPGPGAASWQMTSMSNRKVQLFRDYETPIDDRAGSADDAPPLPEPALERLERDLVAQVHRLRSDPPGYIPALEQLRDMYDERTLIIPGQLSLLTAEGASAVTEAIAALATAPPQPTLTYSTALSRAARQHALDLARGSNLTSTGADGSRPDERMNLHGQVAGVYAENIAAAYTEAELMILQLVVDDGVVTRANRSHLLAPMFRAVGVGCAHHPRYQVVCVIDLVEYFQAE